MNSCARFILSVFVLPALHAAAQGQSPGVRINELLASNQTTNTDPQYGTYCGWVELYNAGQTAVDLSGYWVSDDPDNPWKYKVPSGTSIPGGGLLLLWADGRDTGLHTSFKLNKAGGLLGLYTPAAVAVDTVGYGAQLDDVSYGRIGDDPNEWSFFSPPSPGAANDPQHAMATAPEPVFSITGGFYHGTQTLRFENSDQIDIYYSLDGTAPDDSSSRYLIGIALGATTAVRAIGYQSGRAPSRRVTHTYFIDEPVHLPFISIVTDPDNFFSDERGIYVTGTNGGGGYCDTAIRNVKQDWERPVNVELFETDGTLAFNQPAGVTIFGGCSRHRYPEKSLALFARRVYGKGTFHYQLFPDKDIDRFEAFLLRCSGDDQPLTMFRDALSQMLLVEYMDADVQAYRPAVLFINGRYWGIHNIREKINEHYLAENFGVAPDEVNLLESNGIIDTGADAGYTAMVNYADSHDMANSSYYDVVKAQMDIDQYIDYEVGHLYLAAKDWPAGNIRFWRANSGPYARWRWINFDLDFCLRSGYVDDNTLNVATAAGGTSWPNPDWSTRLLRNLLKNEGFRNEFIQRYAYHMNTTFDPNRVGRFVDEFQSRLAPEIPRHITRWGGQKDPDALETWISPTFNSMEQWEQNVDEMRSFATERPAVTVSHVLNHFRLSGTSRVGLALNVPNAAVLQINGKRLPDGFAGLYFNDVPVVVRATPRLGYTFSHWEVQSGGGSSVSMIARGSTWRYSDTGADLGSQWRQTSYNDSAWRSGPAQLGYGDGDEATVVRYGGNAGSKYVTTYFRKSFQVADATRLRSLSMSLLVDDGAVAYLNGQEIARVNMPSGSISYSTLAADDIPDEDAFTDLEVSAAGLKSGTNVLAVEVHQSSRDSTDISFDCSLSGETGAEVQTGRVDTPETRITLSGDTQLTVFLEASPTTIADPVVITEINYKSAPEADSEDWVELYNRTAAVVSLAGWRFSDGAGHAYAFAPDTVLWPDSYLVLCRNTFKFKAVHPGIKDLLGNLEFGFSPDGESLRVLDAQNNIVDRVDYESVAPWPRTAAGTGSTIELVDGSSDNNRGENWRATTRFGTPGTGPQ